MNRDKEIYQSNFGENLLEDKVHYTTDFNPQRYQEVGVTDHWIIDECDETMFDKPGEFHKMLLQMGKHDTITCLTATPCKPDQLESEHKFINLCEFKMCNYHKKSISDE